MGKPNFYLRCKHCGLAHPIDTEICPISGQKLASPRGFSKTQKKGPVTPRGQGLRGAPTPASLRSGGGGAGSTAVLVPPSRSTPASSRRVPSSASGGPLSATAGPLGRRGAMLPITEAPASPPESPRTPPSSPLVARATSLTLTPTRVSPGGEPAAVRRASPVEAALVESPIGEPTIVTMSDYTAPRPPIEWRPPPRAEGSSVPAPASQPSSRRRVEQAQQAGAVGTPHVGPLPKNPNPLLGKIVGGRYLVRSFIARGATSMLWACEDVMTGKLHALKVSRVASQLGERSLERFYHEARVLGMLGHPSICAVDSLGQLEDGTPYLVIELLEGVTLGERLRTKGPLTLEEACLMGLQVLEVLALTHALKILHRDIKPANIFWCACEGGVRVKVLDFGISKQLTAEQPHLTPTGFVMGTPLYLAPEQTQSRRVDARADLYAVGLLLHESLTARSPFVVASYEELIRKIRFEGPPPIKSLAPYVPDALADVITKAVHRERRARFASATAMYDALLCAYRGFVARSAGPFRQARTLPVPALDESAQAPVHESTKLFRK